MENLIAGEITKNIPTLNALMMTSSIVSSQFHSLPIATNQSDDKIDDIANSFSE